MAQKKVLVTGGAGFIGSTLVRALIKKNFSVVVVDDLSTGSLANLKEVIPKINFRKNDISRWIRTNQLNDFEFIFHLAGNPYIPPSVKNPAGDYKNNLHNTFLILEKLRQMRERPHLIYASSAAVYGSPKKLPIREDHPLDPISPYGVSKLGAERYAAVYSLIYGLKTTSLRFFSVYGPGQKKQIIFDLIEKIRMNPGELEVYGDGSQIRDFIFVEDLVQAIILIAKKAAGKGEVFNIASGTHYSVKQVVAEVCKVCQVKPIIKYTGKVRPGDADKWIVDISKIQKLGFKANFGIEKGILKVKEWIEENY